MMKILNNFFSRTNGGRAVLVFSVILLLLAYQNFTSTHAKYPVLSIESSAIVEGKLSILNMGFPPGDIRRYGAVGDAALDGSSGTQNQIAIQAALNLFGIPTYIPSGNWKFISLVIPAQHLMYGAGIHVSNLVATGPVSTSKVITDAGDARGIEIRDLSIECNHEYYSEGIFLGHGEKSFGADGELNNVLVRNLPNGVPGIDVFGKSGHFGRLIVQNTGGVSITGMGNTIEKIESVESSGVLNSSGVFAAANLGDANVNAVEIKSSSADIPVYFEGSVNLGTLWIDPCANLGCPTNFDHFVEISSEAPSWAVNNVVFYPPGTEYWSAAKGIIKWGSNYLGAVIKGEKSEPQFEHGPYNSKAAVF